MKEIKKMSKDDLVKEVYNLRLKLREETHKDNPLGLTEKLDTQFFKHILENIPSDLVVFDKNHTYLYINPVAVKDPKMRSWLTGKTDYDYCEKKGKDKSLADNRRSIFNKVKKTLEGVFYEEMMVDDKGLEIWNLRRLYPVSDSDGYLQYVVGYATDITPLKKIEKDLKKAKVKAEVSMRIKEEFLANMSHEIRTPMNAILGMSNLLQNLKLDDKNKSYLNGITNSAKNLVVVINDILDFSKMSSDKLILEKIPFNLQEEIEQLKVLFQVRSSEKNINLVFEIDPQIEGLSFEGDALRLTQVLNNLLGNAIKFTTQGTVSFSVVVKSLAVDRMMLSFSIKDSGIGIDEEHQEIIFMPFSQADSSTTRKYGGTGLGLSISKRLVRLMGGRLSLKSMVGQGSEFYFDLMFPIVQHSESSTDLEIDLENTIPKNFKVLLVEDNPMNQLYASSILEMYTDKLFVATNGKEAIDVLNNNSRFDVILMDIQMPIMSGKECTKFIRKNISREVPIVALTANAFKKDKDSYKACGIDGYLSKPFEQEDLLKILHSVLC